MLWGGLVGFPSKVHVDGPGLVGSWAGLVLALMPVFPGHLTCVWHVCGQGLILALLLLVGAPLGESFIVNVLHLWHYGASSDRFVSAVGRVLVQNRMALSG